MKGKTESMIWPMPPSKKVDDNAKKELRERILRGFQEYPVKNLK